MKVVVIALLRPRTITRIVAGVALGASASAGAAMAQGPAECGAPLRSQVVVAEMPGSPFQALPSADGCWIYASMPMTNSGKPAIALISRTNGTIALKQLLEVQGNPTGMVVTHDGRTLIVAAGQRIILIDTQRLVSQPERSVLSYLDEPTTRTPRLGRIYANVTADDRTLFVADENAQTISVIDLVKARETKYRSSAIVGQIPTGTLPISLTAPTSCCTPRASGRPRTTAGRSRASARAGRPPIRR